MSAKKTCFLSDLQAVPLMPDRALENTITEYERVAFQSVDPMIVAMLPPAFLERWQFVALSELQLLIRCYAERKRRADRGVYRPPALARPDAASLVREPDGPPEA